MEQFTQLIGTLGFPIACCIMMFLDNVKQRAQNTEQLRQYSEQLAMQLSVINELKNAICELTAYIKGKGGDAL